MIHVVLLCAGFLAGQTVESSPITPDLKTYEALRLKAGRDPGAQVKVALWCEAHGLSAEQMKHLAMAVLVDPRNSVARGLLGLLDSNGRWETLEKARERLSADSARLAHQAEYERRRAKLTDDEIRSQRARDRLEQDGQFAAAYSARVKDNRRLAKAHVEPGPLVRGQRAQARGDRPLHGGHPLRSLPRPNLEAARLCQARRPVDQSEAGRDSGSGRARAGQADHEWEPLLKKWKSWLATSGKPRKPRSRWRP